MSMPSDPHGLNANLIWPNPHRLKLMYKGDRVSSLHHWTLVYAKYCS